MGGVSRGEAGEAGHSGPPAAAGAVVVPLFGRRGGGQEPLMTKAEAARFLRCSERTIERHMKERGLPFSKPFARGAVRFRRSELDLWLSQGQS